MGKIRRASLDDWDHVVSLACEFNEKYGTRVLNVNLLYKLIGNCIENHVVLIKGNSAIVGYLYEDPLYGHTVLSELGWFSKDSTGLGLLKEFIDVGKELHVDEVRLSSLTSNPRVGELLKTRYGFTHTEQVHSLNLT